MTVAIPVAIPAFAYVHTCIHMLCVYVYIRTTFFYSDLYRRRCEDLPWPRSVQLLVWLLEAFRERGESCYSRTRLHTVSPFHLSVVNRRKDSSPIWEESMPAPTMMTPTVLSVMRRASVPHHNDVHGLIRSGMTASMPNHDDVHGLTRSMTSMVRPVENCASMAQP